MRARFGTERALAAGGLAVVGLAIAYAAIGTAGDGAVVPEPGGRAVIGEARSGGVTVELAPALAGVRLTEAKVPGRPIVVVDPGHGGRDPGAVGVSGSSTEKALALALGRELRDRLAERGRVRVALTREDDRYLTLDQRAAIARGLGASLYLSLHIDSAPNPLARGASVYSLSDVASDPEAARMAARENASAAPLSSEADDSVRSILADLALRDRMNESASLAERLVRSAGGRFQLRPEPHRFASFHVLRSAGVPAVLFEAGYLSNTEDEALLLDPRHRSALVSALAQAIEADVASRIVR